MYMMTDEERAALARLCREVGVKRLDLFGSATSDDFDPDQSDLDFLVEFLPEAAQPWMGEYLDLQTGLEEIFERKVDVVPDKRFKNRFFRETVKRTRRIIYAAEVPQAS